MVRRAGRGKVSLHGTCPSILTCSPHLWLNKPQSPAQSGGRQLCMVSPGLLHDEPYFGWKPPAPETRWRQGTGQVLIASLCVIGPLASLSWSKLHLISLASSRVCSASALPSVPCISQTGHFCDLLFLPYVGHISVNL